jgi:methylphosphotriester-DNA--protein-cysteine methyltransferase
VRATGELNELFAALLAEPFDPDRLARAMLEMTPADYERIEKLYASLEQVPKGKRQ